MIASFREIQEIVFDPSFWSAVGPTTPTWGLLVLLWYRVERLYARIDRRIFRLEYALRGKLPIDHDKDAA